MTTASADPSGPADPADSTRDADQSHRHPPLSTVDALVQLSFLIQSVLSAAGTDHDISIIQLRLLGVLRDRQVGMLELGTHLGLDKSSMTGLVGRAEKRGLVQRSPSPHDGRAVLVCLTPAGRELVEQGAADVSRRITELTEHLTTTQISELTQLATALVYSQPQVLPDPVAA